MRMRAVKSLVSFVLNQGLWLKFYIPYMTPKQGNVILNFGLNFG